MTDYHPHPDLTVTPEAGTLTLHGTTVTCDLLHLLTGIEDLDYRIGTGLTGRPSGYGRVRIRPSPDARSWIRLDIPDVGHVDLDTDAVDTLKGALALVPSDPVEGPMPQTPKPSPLP